MKTVSLEQATLDTCVREAQLERVVVLRDGRPVALIVGVEGWDTEHLELARSNTFWKLIAERRAEKVLTRTVLERKIKAK